MPRLTAAGTWIPLPEGRALAEKNGVLDKLRVIFDFVPGDTTPPPAPKHSAAVSNKPKTSRQSNAARKRMQGTRDVGLLTAATTDICQHH